MNPRRQHGFRLTSRLILKAGAAAAFFMPRLIAAQDEGPREVQIPNPMALHTWFIIVAFGAFLAWCISYILDRRREAASQKPRLDNLLQQKNQLLDRLAQLEAQKKSGSIPESRYEREYKKVRGRLSGVLSRLKQDPLEE